MRTEGVAERIKGPLVVSRIATIAPPASKTTHQHTSIYIVAAIIAVALALAQLNPASWIWSISPTEYIIPGYSGPITFQPQLNSPLGGICGTDSEINARMLCNAIGHPVPEWARPPVIVIDGSNTEVMWLSEFNCPSTATTIADCTYHYDSEGSACSSAYSLYVNCAALPPTTPSPTEAPGRTWTVQFRPVTDYLDSTFGPKFKLDVGAAVEDPFSGARVNIISITPSAVSVIANTNVTVVFQFTPKIQDNDPPTWLLDGIFEQKAARFVIFGSNFGFLGVVGVLPETTTPPPKHTTDLSQWQYRLVGGNETWQGRLELRPNASQPWGTVCSNNFNSAEAYAACGNAGYNATWSAVAIKFGSFGSENTGPIYLTHVNCYEQPRTMANCTYDYFPANDQAQTGCYHYEDVGLDCYFGLGPPKNTTGAPTYSPTHLLPPILWTAVLLTSDYNALVMKGTLSVVLSLPANRIWILNNATNGTFTIVNFMFQNGSPEDPPRAAYDAELASIDSVGLLSLFDFQELFSNMTSEFNVTAAPKEGDVAWQVSLSKTYYGLAQVRPKPNANNSNPSWGTICNDNTVAGATVAQSICKNAGMFQPGGVAYIIPRVSSSNTGVIYLNQLVCRSGDNLDACNKTISTPTQKNNNCTHLQDTGVMCTSLTAPVTYNVNALVTTYSATFVGTSFSLPTFYSKLQQFVQFPSYRLQVTNVVYLSNSVQVDFFFGDPTVLNVNGMQRIDLDAWFQAITPEGLLQLFGIQLYTKSGGPPNIPTPPPAQTVNLAGWKYRLVGSLSYRGRLEVLPAGQTQWGTVCGAFFFSQEAVSACRSLNFSRTNFASVALPGSADAEPPGTGPVYLTNVACPFNVSLTSCTMIYHSSPNTVPSTCSHSSDITIDCDPAATLAAQSNVLFTAVVAKNQTNTSLRRSWAALYNISVDRVVMGTFRDVLNFSFINFTFRNDGTVLPLSGPGSGSGGNIGPGGGGDGAVLLEEQQVVAAAKEHSAMELHHSMNALAGAEEPPGASDLVVPRYSDGSLDVGALALTGSPYEFLNLFTRYLRAGPLAMVSVFELRDNVTKPNGAIQVTNVSTWNWFMKDLDHNDHTKYGRIDLQPGPDAPFGTVCGQGFGRAAAIAACRLYDTSVTSAIAIPSFKEEGRGIIYLGSVSCPATAPYANGLVGCGYTFSLKEKKLNDCSHDSDAGVICGTGVGNQTTFPVRYLIYFDPDVYFNTTFIAAITAQLGIPANRVNLSKSVFNATLQAVLVNFSFIDGPNLPLPAGAATRGDCDLFLQSLNSYGLYSLFGIIRLFPNATVNAIPQPTTTRPPTSTSTQTLTGTATGSGTTKPPTTTTTATATPSATATSSTAGPTTKPPTTTTTATTTPSATTTSSVMSTPSATATSSTAGPTTKPPTITTTATSTPSATPTSSSAGPTTKPPTTTTTATTTPSATTTSSVMSTPSATATSSTAGPTTKPPTITTTATSTPSATPTSSSAGPTAKPPTATGTPSATPSTETATSPNSTSPTATATQVTSTAPPLSTTRTTTFSATSSKSSTSTASATSTSTPRGTNTSTSSSVTPTSETTVHSSTEASDSTTTTTTDTGSTPSTTTTPQPTAPALDVTVNLTGVDPQLFAKAFAKAAGISEDSVTATLVTSTGESTTLLLTFTSDTPLRTAMSMNLTEQSDLGIVSITPAAAANEPPAGPPGSAPSSPFTTPVIGGIAGGGLVFLVVVGFVAQKACRSSGSGSTATGSAGSSSRGVGRDRAVDGDDYVAMNEAKVPMISQERGGDVVTVESAVNARAASTSSSSPVHRGRGDTTTTHAAKLPAATSPMAVTADESLVVDGDGSSTGTHSQ